jgi:hypothetical protein
MLKMKKAFVIKPIVILAIVLGFIAILPPPGCRAEGEQATGTAVAALDFTDGAGGFTLDEDWVIRDGELLCSPKPTVAPRPLEPMINFYPDELPEEFAVEVKARWLGGFDGYYGLLIQERDAGGYLLLIEHRTPERIPIRFGPTPVYLMLDSYQTPALGLPRQIRLPGRKDGDTLRVVHRAAKLTGYFNEQKAFEFELERPLRQAQAGLYLSVPMKCGFDDFSIVGSPFVAPRLAPTAQEINQEAP